MALILQELEVVARDKPQPASIVTGEPVDRRGNAPSGAGAAPGERGVTKQAIGGREPEGSARLDGYVVALAGRALLALDHLPPTGFPFAQQVNGRGPVGLIRPAPGIADLFHGDRLGCPILAVEMGQGLLTLRLGFGEGRNNSLFIFMRLLQIVELQRIGRHEVVPFAVPLEIANRPRDFGEPVRAGNPKPAVAGQGQARELLEARLRGREQHLGPGVVGNFDVEFEQAVREEENTTPCRTGHNGTGSIRRGEWSRNSAAISGIGWRTQSLFLNSWRPSATTVQSWPPGLS